MKRIENATQAPLRVPLPKGKTLHLGPRQVGEVAASALEHPPFADLVSAGRIKVLGEGEHNYGAPERTARSGAPAPVHGDTGVPIHPSGDR